MHMMDQFRAQVKTEDQRSREANIQQAYSIFHRINSFILASETGTKATPGYQRAQQELEDQRAELKAANRELKNITDAAWADLTWSESLQYYVPMYGWIYTHDTRFHEGRTPYEAIVLDKKIAELKESIKTGKKHLEKMMRFSVICKQNRDRVKDFMLDVFYLQGGNNEMSPRLDLALEDIHKQILALDNGGAALQVRLNQMIYYAPRTNDIGKHYKDDHYTIRLLFNEYMTKGASAACAYLETLVSRNDRLKASLPALIYKLDTPKLRYPFKHDLRNDLQESMPEDKAIEHCAHF